MLLTAMVVCLGHGANDVANSISPFLIVLGLHNHTTRIAYGVGGAGISLGLIALGSRVMKTLGDKIIVLDFAKGFSSQFATSVCIIIGTEAGVPLSTTHCLVGAIGGLIFAQKTSPVKRVYGEDAGEAESKKVNFRTLGKIIIWWILNLPIVTGATILITWFIVFLSTN
mmetsp:Transcript_5494/g.7044  ORF Transcript_5494/g.7044 Transcript_5494/m.7044 type:complete len:169 (-) Transcript_5494:4-510(-)